jgi:monothiol glutaredoxin
MSLTTELEQEIKQLVTSKPIVLFMKGTRGRPQCGFSASVTEALDELVDDYVTVNVLERPDLREGVKTFSSWPTIPQLYVNGEFVGGADIVRGLVAKGELAAALGVKPVEVSAPTIIVTDAAAEQFRGALEEREPGQELRFEVDRGFRYGLALDAPKPGDFQLRYPGFVLLVDRASAKRCDGATIDFASRGGEAGFKITNPREPAKVRGITARELKQRLDAGAPTFLFDMRTDREIELARIPGARVLDEAADASISALPKDTPLVFHCHHGQRSQAAAEHYLGQGFTQVFNLVGGIEAWSRDVDPTVPRY